MRFPNVPAVPQSSPGSQRERTHLAWLRTFMAFFVNGGLLLLRHDLEAPTVFQVIGASASFALGAGLLIAYASNWRPGRSGTLKPDVQDPGLVAMATAATTLVGVMLLSAVLVF